MYISNEVSKELKALDLDGVRLFSADCSRENDTLYLYKGKLRGIYVVDVGLILEPVHWEVMRITNDMIKVGEKYKEGDGEIVLYGGYSISSRSWVIPHMYEEHEFWIEFKKYQAITARATHG